MMTSGLSHVSHTQKVISFSRRNYCTGQKNSKGGAYTDTESPVKRVSRRKDKHIAFRPVTAFTRRNEQRDSHALQGRRVRTCDLCTRIHRRSVERFFLSPQRVCLSCCLVSAGDWELLGVTGKIDVQGCWTRGMYAVVAGP